MSVIFKDTSLTAVGTDGNGNIEFTIGTDGIPVRKGRKGPAGGESFTGPVVMSGGATITGGLAASGAIAFGAGTLGFFGITPAAQHAAIADATDAPTAISQLNLLLASMRTYGLVHV